MSTTPTKTPRERGDQPGEPTLSAGAGVSPAPLGPLRRQRAMARFLGISARTLRQLAREHPDFPRPLYLRHIGDGLPVWDQAEVLAWLAGRPRQLTDAHQARGGRRRRAA